MVVGVAEMSWHIFMGPIADVVPLNEQEKIESDNLSLDSCCLDKPFKLDLIWKKSWRENEKKN